MCARHVWTAIPGLHWVVDFSEGDRLNFIVISWIVTTALSVSIGYRLGTSASETASAVVKSLGAPGGVIETQIKGEIEPIRSEIYSERRQMDELIRDIKSGYPSSSSIIVEKAVAAQQALDDGRYAASDSMYTLLIQFYPDIAEFQRGLAQALQYQGKLAEALTHQQEYVDRKPQNSAARTQLGFLLIQLGRRKESIVQFEKALTLAEDDWARSATELLLGSALADDGQNELAKTHLRRALQTSGRIADGRLNAFVLDRLAVLYLAQDSLRQALEAGEHAVKSDSSRAEAWSNLGVIYVKDKQISKGIECFNRALSLNPDLSKTRYALSQAFADRGDPSNAELQLKILLSKDPAFAQEYFGLSVKR